MMILRNLSVLTVALSLGCSANASTISSGFYVGMGAGMERMNGQRSERMDDPLGNYLPQSFSNKQNMKANGPLVDVFGGYLHRFEHFAVGLETFFGVGKVSDTINRSWVANSSGAECTYKATVEKKNHFGIHVQLGTFLFERVFVYGLAGFRACQLRYASEQQAYQAGDGTGFNPTSLQQSQFSQSKLAYGFDYGLGVAFQTGRLRFGVEGYITNMKQQGFQFPFLPYEDHSRATVNSHIKPINTVLKFKVSITF